MNYVLDRSGSEVATRLGIWDLISDWFQWSLFLQSIIAMQAVRGGPDFSIGHYSLSGIHGEPSSFYAWNGSFTTSRSGSGGYCPHGSILFPTWHRPYVALYEQVMQQHAIRIADTYRGTRNATQYRAAARVLRFPYWDWAIDAVPPAEIISLDTLTYVAPNGRHITVSNPFLAYKYNRLENELDSYWSGFEQTIRHPRGRPSPLMSLRRTLRRIQPQTLQDVRSMFQFIDNWPQFSNHAADASDTSKANSLESIHDRIHTAFGSMDGHMSYPEVAGFDPVFMMHHSQVDRLLALWQVFWPDVYVSNGVADSPTRWLAPGDSMSASTQLPPFYISQSGSYWSSSDVRDTTALGYTYPEFSGNASPEQVKDRVRSLYGFGNPQFRTRAIKTRGLLPSTIDIKKPGSLLTQGIVGGFYEWTARMRYKGSELKRPFAMHFFFGALPTSDFLGAKNYVGTITGFVGRNAGHDESQGGGCNDSPKSQGFVQLTPALSNMGIGGDVFHPLDVEGFLISEFNWCVTEADFTTLINTDTISCMSVDVMCALTLPVLSGTSTILKQDDPIIFPAITARHK